MQGELVKVLVQICVLKTFKINLCARLSNKAQVSVAVRRITDDPELGGAPRDHWAQLFFKSGSRVTHLFKSQGENQQ